MSGPIEKCSLCNANLKQVECWSEEKGTYFTTHCSVRPWKEGKDSKDPTKGGEIYERAN